MRAKIIFQPCRELPVDRCGHPTGTWASNAQLLQRRPRAPWAALVGMLLAVQGRQWQKIPAVLAPVLGSSVQEKCGFPGASPAKSH